MYAFSSGWGLTFEFVAQIGADFVNHGVYYCRLLAIFRVLYL